MDTSKPSPGIPEEQSPWCPENNFDFTIARISRKGSVFREKSGSEAILGRKISHRKLSSAEDVLPTGFPALQELIASTGSNSQTGWKFHRV
jgi:hypothetical protein